MEETNNLIRSLLVTDHTRTVHGEEQLFCPRHDINVWRYATDICRCVLLGAPIERINYRYGNGPDVYITGVACAKARHTGDELFVACYQCLGEALADHPKAMSRADIEDWEAWEHMESEENRGKKGGARP